MIAYSQKDLLTLLESLIDSAWKKAQSYIDHNLKFRDNKAKLLMNIATSLANPNNGVTLQDGHRYMYNSYYELIKKLGKSTSTWYRAGRDLEDNGLIKIVLAPHPWRKDSYGHPIPVNHYRLLTIEEITSLKEGGVIGQTDRSYIYTCAPIEREKEIYKERLEIDTQEVEGKVLQEETIEFEGKEYILITSLIDGYVVQTHQEIQRENPFSLEQMQLQRLMERNLPRWMHFQLTRPMADSIERCFIQYFNRDLRHWESYWSLVGYHEKKFENNGHLSIWPYLQRKKIDDVFNYIFE